MRATLTFSPDGYMVQTDLAGWSGHTSEVYWNDEDVSCNATVALQIDERTDPEVLPLRSVLCPDAEYPDLFKVVLLNPDDELIEALNVLLTANGAMLFPVAEAEETGGGTGTGTGTGGSSSSGTDDPCGLTATKYWTVTNTPSNGDVQVFHYQFLEGGTAYKFSRQKDTAFECKVYNEALAIGTWSRVGEKVTFLFSDSYTTDSGDRWRTEFSCSTAGLRRTAVIDNINKAVDSTAKLFTLTETSDCDPKLCDDALKIFDFKCPGL